MTTQDRPLKGALLMQTLARVNRTYKGKQDGLLVAYAPLLENLNAALREFTHDADPTDPSVGRRDEAGAKALLHAVTALSLPNRILQVIAPDEALPSGHPAQGKGQVDGKATLYVCVGPTCSLPVTEPAAVPALLLPA